MEPTGPKLGEEADNFETNSCTLCNFQSPIKSSFQRHLMESHGLKLKASEEGSTGDSAILNDYGLGEKLLPQQIFPKCKTCNKNFNSIHTLHFHTKSCKKRHEAVKNKNPSLRCKKCRNVFQTVKNLQRHSVICEMKRFICCQLCSTKCFEMCKMQRHLIDKHNLICKPVEEPDFEQALNGTPYTLERVTETNTLQDVSTIPIIQIPSLTSPCCKKTFLNQTRLFRHLKFSKCSINHAQ